MPTVRPVGDPDSGKVSLDSFPVDPQLLSRIQQAMPRMSEEMKRRALPAVLLVLPQLRPQLARYARTFAQGLAVVSYNEVPDTMHIDVVGVLG